MIVSFNRNDFWQDNPNFFDWVIFPVKNNKILSMIYLSYLYARKDLFWGRENNKNIN